MITSPDYIPDNWFRIPHNVNTSDEHEIALKEEEERRKFEWLVPEHLPTSPLCPLHPKYRGPCKGMCLCMAARKAGMYFGIRGKMVMIHYLNGWDETVQLAMRD